MEKLNFNLINLEGLTRISLKKIKLSKIKIKNSKLIFDSFINNNEFSLKNTYNKINSYDGIYYEYNEKYTAGVCMYNEQTNKNYINIDFKDDLYDYSVLVHELGHCQMNWINKGSSNTSFSEVYSDFLQLKFLDYLKKFNLNEMSLNLKLKYLDFISNMSISIYDMIGSNIGLSNVYMEFYTKYLFNSVLTCYFYNLYLEDKTECINRINILKKSISISDNYELIEKLGIKLDDILNLSSINLFIENLTKESNFIKNKKLV